MIGELVPVDNLPAEAVASELADIRALRQSGGDYADEQREIALLERQLAPTKTADAQPPQPLVRLSPDEAREVITHGLGGTNLIEAWEAAGGVDRHLAQAQATAERVLGELHEEDRADFIAAFDALPAIAKQAVHAELSIDPPILIRVASDEELERFAGTQEGRDLLREWGDKAPRNVSVLRSRLDRIVLNTPADEQPALAEFLDGLPPASFKAVAKGLLGVFS